MKGINPKIFNLKINNYGLIILSIAIYMLATINGNHYTADGHTYVEIAHNIALGYGYLWGKEGEVWVWVPFYPFLLSAGYFTGHIEAYIWFTHLAFLILTNIVWIAFINREIKDDRYKTVTALFIVLNTSVLYCYVFVLSEAALITVSGLYLYFISRWLDDRRYEDLIYAALAGFTALLTRNAGIFFLAGSFLYVLVHLILEGDKKGVRIFAIHMIFVLSGFAAWNINKLWLGGRLNFVAELVPFLDVGRNWNLISKNIATAFIPFAFPQMVHTIFTFVLFAFVGYVMVRNKTEYSIRMLLSVIIFYLLFWLIVPADRWEMERFLAPVFPPILFTVFYLLEKSKALNKYPSWVFILLLLYPFVRIIKNALFWGGFLKSFNFDDFLSYL